MRSETTGAPDGRDPAARKVDLLVFDLDGTLVRSDEDIAAAVNFMRRSLGLPTLTNETIRGFVGDGITYGCGPIWFHRTLLRMYRLPKATPPTAGQAHKVILT